MKTRLLLVTLLSLVYHASSVNAEEPQKNSSLQAAPTHAVKQYTIEQFMDTTRLGGSSFSGDEKSILFHSNKTGIFNVYSMPVAGGAPQQLTNSTKESTYAVSYFPADARFPYRYDKVGTRTNTFTCASWMARSAT